MGVAQSLSASSSQIRGKSDRGDGYANAWWQRINKARPQKTPDSFTCIIASEFAAIIRQSPSVGVAHQVWDSKQFPEPHIGHWLADVSLDGERR